MKGESRLMDKRPVTNEDGDASPLTEIHQYETARAEERVHEVHPPCNDFLQIGRCLAYDEVEPRIERQRPD